ncbi:hypothetical protein BU24DRAFT_463450 [Aaosphaeria arxii CBS 175.79]|uniref:Transcription factor domain-containing protein n=1 Tax=Aaosphaeria arxii CBS 175.79 TaxID=1450172 RepID=A0A6A5XP18_9PLEO|nr:uncharacterized protein BU24DRAFT_463450 [Aaosphaeria arxii CBS 175.79]KAF2014683.1 hypothetical protein BU24DRAFT_463450 [Aaosphaeria arxii CBS 175.79]
MLLAMHIGAMNDDDLCMDLLNVEAEDLGKRPALMVWGEPWDIMGWEANLSFLKKWGWLIRGCPEILEGSNYWREKRGAVTRPAPASYHEKHFNSIHESLSEIKESLRRLDQSQASLKPSLGAADISTDQIAPSALETTFQGETSFNNLSALASISAEVSAREAEHTGQGGDIYTSLSSLKDLLRNEGKPSSADYVSFPLASKAATTKTDLPPVSAVLAVLRRASAHAPFVIIHSAQRDHAVLEELCKKIYFPTKPYTKGELTLMNGMLSFVFFEYSANPCPDISSSDCVTYGKLCEKNFIAGLQDYECLVTPKLENIQCLMIGAMKAQEDSLPSLCWTFVSAGARLCQILGYHREAVVARDPPERKSSDTLSGYDDIDVKVYSLSSNPRFRPWDRAFHAFIEFSRLQGRIYDRLYTAKAQREQPETRARAVEELSALFSAWHTKFKEIDTTGAQDKNDLDLIVGSSDFIFYSALNLLYGAKTSPAAATHISAKRYEVARLSLQCHIRSTARLLSNDVPKWRIYSDWILLYSSFTPFLVVFTHAIASHSSEDVELLDQVLQTLEAPRGYSEAVNRLYQVCRVFLEFVKAFVPSHHPFFGSYNLEEDSFTFPSNGGESLSLAQNIGTCDPMSENQEVRNDDLESMAVFLENCLGENSGMTGLWSQDFSNSQWM